MSDAKKRLILAISGLGAWGLIFFAWYYLENVLYLQPCPLCMMQRVAFAIAGFFMLLEAIFWNARPVFNLIMRLGKYFGIFLGIGLAARHLYIQSLPAGSTPACGFDFWGVMQMNGFWQGILTSMKGTGECATVDKFWGLSIPLWALFAFLGLLVIAVVCGKAKHKLSQYID